MNKKVGIYIILSAILLYLYYRRNDLAIFAAFVAVVAGTLIFRDQNQTDDREGFGFGGGGGDSSGKLDKECANMGFKPIKLDKDDLAGSLEHVIKNIEKVAAKHWPYDSMGGNQDSTTEKDEDRKKKNAELESFMEVWTKEATAELGDNKKKDNKKKENKKKENEKKENKQKSDMFINASARIYEQKKYDNLVAETPENIKKMISGGEITLKILEKVSKSDEIDSSVKKTLKYLNCLCKYWISIYKELQKANDEDKPKKKKKASEDDEGGGDDEEDKPKKKKASEDDEE